MLQGMQKFKYLTVSVPRQAGAKRCCRHAAVGEAVLSIKAQVSLRFCSPMF